MFHDCSLSRLGPVQAKLRGHKSTNITGIGLYILHHKSQILTFNITDLEGSVLFSCADTLSLGLLKATDKLNKNYVVVPKS